MKLRRECSSITLVLQQISLEYEEAQRELTGLWARSTRHSFITARMERIGFYREQLVTYLGEA